MTTTYHGLVTDQRSDLHVHIAMPQSHNTLDGALDQIRSLYGTPGYSAAIHEFVDGELKRTHAINMATMTVAESRLVDG